MYRGHRQRLAHQPNLHSPRDKDEQTPTAESERPEIHLVNSLPHPWKIDGANHLELTQFGRIKVGKRIPSTIAESSGVSIVCQGTGHGVVGVHTDVAVESPTIGNIHTIVP